MMYDSLSYWLLKLYLGIVPHKLHLYLPVLLLQGYDSIPAEIPDPKAKEVRWLLKNFINYVVFHSSPVYLGRFKTFNLPNPPEISFFFVFVLFFNFSFQKGCDRLWLYFLRDSNSYICPVVYLAERMTLLSIRIGYMIFV